MLLTLHTLTFAHTARLRCCSPASGMSHHADVRRAWGGVGRETAHGGVSLVNALAARSTAPSRTGCQPVRGYGNAQAARSTAARSASGPYHVVARRGRFALPCGHARRMTLPAAGASKASNRRAWFGRNVRQSCIFSRKFVQYTEIISGNLCGTAMETDINRYISPRAEIKTRQIRYTKRKCLVISQKRRHDNHDVILTRGVDSGNKNSCLLLSFPISVIELPLIYNISLQLGIRSATIFGQGDNRYV